MAWVPAFKLYETNGSTLVYEFPLVQQTNAPQSPMRNIVIEGVRGKGALIINNGDSTWDLEITGIFAIQNADEGYEEITADIADIEDKIPINTPFILRIEKTSSTYFEYNVKRIEAIEYPASLRTDSQIYIVRFKVNTW